MTDERTAIEALARCTFLPGSFNKRFAHSLASTPEDAVLTAKQRACLWKLVWRYRRQMPPACVTVAMRRKVMTPEQRAFEDALDGDPSDWDTRLVYADWLGEHGQDEYELAQRWMVERGYHPQLLSGGLSESLEPYTIQNCNYEWLWDCEVWRVVGSDSLGHFHKSREAAERALGKALAAQLKQTPEA